VVVVAAVGVWFVREYRERKELAAQSALDAARAAVQANNLPLAASDLGRIVSSYRGTRTADEAAILLAQVRTLQGQPAVAAEELQRAIEQGFTDLYRAPAYGLLGTALEDAGRPLDAAAAYEAAASHAWYEFLKVQYLNDAGRAYAAAGDTARAIAVYRRVVTEFGDSEGATESRVRLAELEGAQQAGTT
jgi:predicted negative regulator of RcsB-dependent stress response